VERTTYLDGTVQFEVVASNLTLESHLADCVVTFEGNSDSQSIRVRTAIRKASSEALLIGIVRNLQKRLSLAGSLPKRRG
jgi:glycerate kinase